ncbi:MAG: hypothetical protein ACRD2G_18280 [Terriglobia bacterium]
MRKVRLCLLLVCWWASLGLGAQSYPAVSPLRRTFDVPNVSQANVVLFIKSPEGRPLYELQCHSAGYTGDPNFDYSGDFECRLRSVHRWDVYSTLLTEDANQSRDWESRGRFFAAQLRGACARVPEFGADRDFKLRGMDLSLRVIGPTFTETGSLKSLRLTVIVRPDPAARRPIAQIVPLPTAGVPRGCNLQRDFVNFASEGSHRASAAQ